MDAAAYREAVALGHHWIGSEHVLLALVRPSQDSRAARVLREYGGTHERLTDELQRLLATSDPPYEPRLDATPGLTPSAYALRGRAEGFAAARDSATIEPEDVLLSLLWHPCSLSSALFLRIGTTRADVKRRLGELGVEVPAGDPPPDDDTRWSERVVFPFEQLAGVLRELHRLLPQEARHSFNHDGKGRAWASVSEGFERELAEAVAQAARG
jgi:ATP-dependent Clp protease ATP-binding subunit ClpA